VPESKQFEPRISREAGRKMDFSEEQYINSRILIVRSVDPGSNNTKERQEQPMKHSRSNSSTDDGIEKDRSDDAQGENPRGGIRLTFRKPEIEIQYKRKSHASCPSSKSETGECTINFCDETINWQVRSDLRILFTWSKRYQFFLSDENGT
jgi:hypothetical protein